MLRLFDPKGLPCLPGWALGILCRRAWGGGFRGAGVEEGQRQAVRLQGVHDPRRGLERATPPTQQRCVLGLDALPVSGLSVVVNPELSPLKLDFSSRSND
jgi:hypothetical protein